MKKSKFEHVFAYNLQGIQSIDVKVGPTAGLTCWL
jgi:hypothetical protein